MEKSLLTERPPFREALRFWFKLGWISFGGTAGHIAIMHDYLVDKRKWISNSRFFHALSLCMLLPGPEAQQLAIYIGWKLHGKKGGIAAGTLFVLPSMLILLLLSIIYVKFGALPLVAAVFSGLKPAVVSLVIVAVVKLARKAITGVLQVAIATMAWAAIFFCNISLLIVIGTTILLALAIRVLKPSLLFQNVGSIDPGGDGAGPAGDTAGPVSDTADRAGDTADLIEDEGSGHFIGSPERAFSVAGLSKEIAAFLLIWAAPLVVLYFCAAAFPFWKTLILFWTRTALFIFGGSYTVLPYVAQFAVGKLHWLSKLQMVDGFALAETTPGPLIIVVAYVGFLAGYHEFNLSILLATAALLLTTFYTFLPCYFYIFVGGPLIEKTHGNAMLEKILNLVTASLVGMIINLTLYLGKDVVFPGGVSIRHSDLYAVSWILICLLSILKFRMKVIYLIAASVGYGLVRYFLA